METYGSLDKKEKLEFILEQIRLTLAKKDFIRAFIMARKVRSLRYVRKNDAHTHRHTLTVECTHTCTLKHTHSHTHPHVYVCVRG